jgi:hypothetical protein
MRFPYAFPWFHRLRRFPAQIADRGSGKGDAFEGGNTVLHNAFNRASRNFHNRYPGNRRNCSAKDKEQSCQEAGGIF